MKVEKLAKIGICIREKRHVSIHFQNMKSMYESKLERSVVYVIVLCCCENPLMLLRAKILIEIYIKAQTIVH